MNANVTTMDSRQPPVCYPIAIRARAKDAGRTRRQRGKKRAKSLTEGMDWLEAAHLRAYVGERPPYDGTQGVWREGETVRVSGAWGLAMALVCVILAALMASLCVLASVDLAFFHGTLFGITTGNSAIPLTVEVYDPNHYAASSAVGAGYIGQMEWNTALSGAESIGLAAELAASSAAGLTPAVPRQEETAAENTASHSTAKNPAADPAELTEGIGTGESGTTASDTGNSGTVSAQAAAADTEGSGTGTAAAAPSEELTPMERRMRSNIFPIRTVSAMRGFLAEERFIVHAGGFLSGSGKEGWRHDYTNCREALENCYAQGNRVCELDFMETSDGYFICGHDGTEKWVYGLPFTKPQTLKTFLSTPMFDEFSTMDLDYVARFLREHRDFYIVTDVKDRNVAFCQTVKALYPDLMNRFLIQIYHEREYNSVRDLGFQFIIFTLYMTTSDEHRLGALIEAVQEHQFVGLTFFADWARDTNFLASIRTLGVPLYVHTVNSRPRQKNLFAAGITAVYTDEVENMDYR